VIGDVSGHGLGPAMVMAQTRAYLRASLRTLPDVGEVLRALNETLLADLEEGRFVTMLLASVDARTRRLTYANAGHPPGYVLGPSGEVRATMDSGGHPLGLFPDCRISSGQSLDLAPGDLVVFLTDGITESRSPDGSFLGVEGALDLVREHRRGSAREVLDGLIAGVRAFAQDGPQDDDATAIICKVEPAQ
jgi:sigma-B regulation protein RsbU (phosphoserine phosphatase)